MKTYTIIRKPDPFSWEQVPAAEIDTVLWTEKTDIRACARVCYDENALYVRLEAKEQDIRATEEGLLCSPCDDSCLEFFLSPEEGDKRYFNIEFNPLGSVYFGIATSIADLTRLIPESGHEFSPEVSYTEDGWYVTYRIPAGLIRRFFPDFQLVSGKRLRGNFFKCGDRTVSPHFLSWNPVTSDKPDFHRSVDFGQLILK